MRYRRRNNAFFFSFAVSYRFLAWSRGVLKVPSVVVVLLFRPELHGRDVLCYSHVITHNAVAGLMSVRPCFRFFSFAICRAVDPVDRSSSIPRYNSSSVISKAPPLVVTFWRVERAAHAVLSCPDVNGVLPACT